MMLLSPSHKFIFIHIPKTGGSSVAAALAPWVDARSHWTDRVLKNLGPYVNRCLPHRWRQFRKHATAAEIRLALAPKVYEPYFKFAFVRNPWDWWVSYYFYVRQSSVHHHHQRGRAMRFEDFVRKLGARGKGRQSTFVLDARGNQIVDCVGRFESLSDDFAEICRRLGITASLKSCNQSVHDDYRSYYDGRTKDLVARLCREEIARFGYEFDGPAAAQAA